MGSLILFLRNARGDEPEGSAHCEAASLNFLPHVVGWLLVPEAGCREVSEHTATSL